MSMFESYESESEYGETPLRAWELAGESEQNESQYESEAETLELELTHELLEVSTEAELDRFLGNLVSSAGKFLSSGVGNAVGGVLKRVAKVALPAAGAALGSFLLPGVGTAIGGKLGSLAGGLLEVGESEMMGEAEAQFEAAHRFVQFGRATVRNAAMAPPNTPPKAVARAAATTAARRYAPGLLRPRPQTFRDRRTDRRQPGPRRGDQQPGRQQRPSQQSYRGQPPRRPGPPWRWGQWQPGQWQPSDAWLGWAAPEPGGAGSGGAPWDQPDGYAGGGDGGNGDGAGGDGDAGDGGGDRGDLSGFEFE